MRDRVPKTCTYLYVHFVWATLDREPFITLEVEEKLHACIAAQCREAKCVPLSINGMSEHVHVLAQMHAAVSVAELAKQMKGASSHLMTHVLALGQPFKWQGSYGAFSVSRSHVERVKAYILHQKQHHANHKLWDNWEQCGTLSDDGTTI